MFQYRANVTHFELFFFRQLWCSFRFAMLSGKIARNALPTISCPTEIGSKHSPYKWNRTLAAAMVDVERRSTVGRALKRVQCRRAHEFSYIIRLETCDDDDDGLTTTTTKQPGWKANHPIISALLCFLVSLSGKRLREEWIRYNQQYPVHLDWDQSLPYKPVRKRNVPRLRLRLILNDDPLSVGLRNENRFNTVSTISWILLQTTTTIRYVGYQTIQIVVPVQFQHKSGSSRSLSRTTTQGEYATISKISTSGFQQLRYIGNVVWKSRRPAYKEWVMKQAALC